MHTVLVTGTAGFIGFHLARRLLSEGMRVIGLDGMTDYYDVQLKRARHDILLENQAFSAKECMLEDADALAELFEQHKPDFVIHLAGQAGVRYSLENPRAYINSNIVGMFNLIDLAREHRVLHFLGASTSSVYGANPKTPFAETDMTDSPLTVYAATKKADEAIAHSYAHLHKMPCTMFRFFTVYGPWGRPDMAPFKFVERVLNGRPIDVYNHGKMSRDFTYIDDLVEGIRLLMDAVPTETPSGIEGDSLSPIAPYRVVNIGNSAPVALMAFIESIEKATGKEAIRNYMPMQKGDVPTTYADSSLLKRLTGYTPKTNIQAGIDAFVAWYRDYYKI